MLSIGPQTVLWLIFPLFSCLAPTHAVDVDLYHFSGQHQRCTAIRPGVCCVAPVLHHPPGYATFAEIHNLLVSDIGILWEAQSGLAGCAGIPVRTQTGPGGVRGLHYTGFSGASYIRLPRGAPPAADGTTSAWLDAEGLLGLVTGYGHWFSTRVKPGTLPGTQRKRRRGVIAGQPGTVYSGPPRWWRYPDLITANGTDFRSTNTSELIYKDELGMVLNVTEMAF